MNKQRLSALTLALAAAGLSFYFSVKAAVLMAPAESFLELCALAGVWECAKLLFGPRAVMGLVSLRRNRAWVDTSGHVFSLVLVAALMLGSVGATYVAAKQASGERQAAVAASVKAMPEHQALMTDISAYDKRIGFLSTLAAAQMDDGQRTVAKRTHDEIAVIQAEKKDTERRLREMTAAVTDLSPLVDVSLWQWASIAIALALEIISIASFTAFHTEHQETPRPAQQPKPATSRTRTAARAPSRTKKTMIAEAIQSGTIKPRVRDVMRYANITQLKSQRTLRKMAQEGLLRRSGRSYELAAMNLWESSNSTSSAMAASLSALN